MKHGEIQGVRRGRGKPLPVSYPTTHVYEVQAWSLHFCHHQYCMVYGIGEGVYIAQWSCNSIAIGWGLQVGRGNKRMIDSNNKALKLNNIL